MGPLFILHKDRCPHCIPSSVLGQAHTWLLNRLTEHQMESQAQIKLSRQGHLMILNLPTASIHSCPCPLPGARRESVWDKGLSMKSTGKGFPWCNHQKSIQNVILTFCSVIVSKTSRLGSFLNPLNHSSSAAQRKQFWGVVFCIFSPDRGRSFKISKVLLHCLNIRSLPELFGKVVSPN